MTPNPNDLTVWEKIMLGAIVGAGLALVSHIVYSRYASIKATGCFLK